MFRVLAAVLLAATAGCQCPGLIGPSPLVPASEAEALAGRRAATSLEQRFGGLYEDARAEARMLRLAGEIMPPRQAGQDRWQPRLLASNAINAFSLPGGRIYLTAGLYRRLGQDDALLAAVLAHEMAHIVLRDSFKPCASSCEEALRREIDADRMAAERLDRSGHGRKALERLLLSIADHQPPGWARARVEAIQNVTVVRLAGAGFR